MEGGDSGGAELVIATLRKRIYRSRASFIFKRVHITCTINIETNEYVSPNNNQHAKPQSSKTLKIKLTYEAKGSPHASSSYVPP